MSTGHVAVVGCGYWGKNLVRNLASLNVLGAVCDTNAGMAERQATEFGARAMDWSSVLSSPDLTAVVIAAPAAMHARLAMEALVAGKHVFVEKPLAIDVAEAEALCREARRRGLVLMVGHLLQYHPAFLRLKALVLDGTLGRINYIYSNRLNLGKFRNEENILWSFAPHDISMILSLAGQEPVSVSAVGANFLNDRIADVTTTHMAFADGMRAHVFVSWLHPFKEQKLIVVGDRGMAVFDDSQPWDSKLVLFRHSVRWKNGLPEPDKAESEAVAVEQSEPLRLECEHFLDCVATGATPRTDGEEGLRVLKVLQQAQDSLAQGNGAPAPLHASSASETTAHFPGATIHESAYIDDQVQIGTGTKIWHFSHILSRTTIGQNVNIGQNVVAGPDVVVGNNCKIQNNVSLYKGVTLEQGVFCGPSCVFTNVLTPRAEIDRKADFRPTLVQRGATIGANATIVCGHTIGAYALVAAGAVVTSDVPAFALVAGVPARRIGWVSRSGERLGDDLVCPRDGSRYRLAAPDVLEEI
ncbi:Gfo/Idh/MocA family oxidoreductase [Magnetospirillum fulvum]|uniref:2,3,4,5-tetrahydropyridine-2,6-dicarboxylate N-acetyltransferase n=1 Tax=Magnetospirillum fulvum MGU-K5 TaxID=1316936 RepID=S9TT81_MAGFU|nr:Gfo/Idh/MocA family oxidoreductase [Magnetospirillum fulvum]EPY01735.1 2,3,4,5-tetrahydropyridine-2,6-dicarboxylate N-acetyltransferase [Magnetospirillum fulvum MGU-K5]